MKVSTPPVCLGMRKILLFIFAITFFAGCRQELLYIEIDSPVTNEEILIHDALVGAVYDDIIFSADLIEDPDQPSLPHISISFSEGFESFDAAQSPSESKVLSATVYAPVLPFYSQDFSVGFSEIATEPCEDSLPATLSAGTEEGLGARSIPIHPLDDIRLPWKAVAVDGFYPGDGEYPLLWVKRAKVVVNYPLEDEEKWVSLLEQVELTFFKALDDVQADQFNLDATPLWIGGVGDIMPGRGVDTILINQEDGLEKIFTDVLPVLQSQDFLIGNLETAVTISREPYPKTYNFRVSPDILPKLKVAGFDYFSLTNNHCFDYKEKGFVDTLNYLESNDILTSGAGHDLEDARRTSTVEFLELNESVQILSLGAYPQERNGFSGLKHAMAKEDSPGILWNTEENRAHIKTVSEAFAGFTILVVHGGWEWTSEPRAVTQQLYRSFIDNGVDLIFAHHPHVLQGMEVYKEGLICYSLGNFIFNGMGNLKYGEDSLVISVGVNGNQLKYLNYYPVKIDGKILKLETETIGYRFLGLTKELMGS